MSGAEKQALEEERRKVLSRAKSWDAAKNPPDPLPYGRLVRGRASMRGYDIPSLARGWHIHVVPAHFVAPDFQWPRIRARRLDARLVRGQTYLEGPSSAEGFFIYSCAASSIRMTFRRLRLTATT